MTHILGCYWAPGHQRPPDIDYMVRLQPPAIRVLDPNPNQLAIAHKAAPNALILPRDWALSEQHDDVKHDPVGTGKRHAQDWRQKLDAWQAGYTDMPPNDQIVVVGINEPKVWEMLPQVVEYTVAWLDECTRLNLRACALNLSVGWPANTGPDTPPNWTPYAPIEAAIKRGKHFLVLHEYWYRTGPRDGWGWLAGRLQHCPWDVPIIIGECGIDMYVDMQRWQNDDKPNRGWRGNVEPERYAVQMEDYARSIDKRVVAILPFLTDYRSNNWESFDTAEAHGRFLARKDNMTPQATPPVTVHLPSVGTGTPATLFVIAPDGANLRATPDVRAGNIITAVAFGQPVTVTAYQKAGNGTRWAQAQYQGASGWMAADLLSFVAPKPLPAPQPSEGPEPTSVPPHNERDNWTRALAFLMGWEGEYQNVANDAGNWTGCAVGKGELKGTKYGISACSYPNLDIINITKEQAASIYYTDYWQRSTADRLEWPLCLAVFDTAVLHGVGTAQKWLAEVGPNPYLFAARRLRSYTKMENWGFWGKAWTLRVADLLEVMGK